MKVTVYIAERLSGWSQNCREDVGVVIERTTVFRHDSTRTSSIRKTAVKGREVLATAPGRASLPIFSSRWLAVVTHLWRSNHYGRRRSMWKNPRRVEMLKSFPVGKTAKSPIKPDRGRVEENSFSF